MLTDFDGAQLKVKQSLDEFRCTFGDSVLDTGGVGTLRHKSPNNLASSMKELGIKKWKLLIFS